MKKPTAMLNLKTKIYIEFNEELFNVTFDIGTGTIIYISRHEEGVAPEELHSSDLDPEAQQRIEYEVIAYLQNYYGHTC